jgi:hypothetical protein
MRRMTARLLAVFTGCLVVALAVLFAFMQAPG